MIGQGSGLDVPPLFSIDFFACWVPCQTEGGNRFGQDVTAGPKHG